MENILSGGYLLRLAYFVFCTVYQNARTVTVIVSYSHSRNPTEDRHFRDSTKSTVIDYVINVCFARIYSMLTDLWIAFAYNVFHGSPHFPAWPDLWTPLRLTVQWATSVLNPQIKPSLCVQVARGSSNDQMSHKSTSTDA